MSPAAALYALYASTFLMLGLQLPFFSLWLEERGLSATEIGVVNGVALVLRLTSAPAVSYVADRYAKGAEALRSVALLLAASACLLALVAGRGVIAVVAIVMLAAIGVIFPLSDTALLRVDRAGGAQFGRVRSAGSFAFLVATIAGGEVLARWGAGASAPLLAAVGLAVAAAAFFAPNTDHLSGPARGPNSPAMLGAFAAPGFVAMILASALVQGAHAAYYGFSVLHWTRLGYSTSVVGLLWATGVVIEILVLWRARALAARFRGETLLLVGAGGAVLRWLLIAAEPPLPALFLVQTLHAASFAFAYLGAVQFLRSAAPPELLGLGVAVNSASTSAATALASVAAGAIFERWGGPAAYQAMAAMAAIGAVAALWARRRSVS